MRRAASPLRDRHREPSRYRVVSISTSTSRLRAMLLGACPRCRAGRIFATPVRMHSRCPSCGLRFAREPGYFTGSVFLSWVVLLPLMCLLGGWVRFRLAPDWPLYGNMALAFAISVPLAFLLVPCSRIVWIHLDRHADP